MCSVVKSSTKPINNLMMCKITSSLLKTTEKKKQTKNKKQNQQKNTKQKQTKSPQTKTNHPTKTASDPDFFSSQLNTQHGSQIFPKSSAPIYGLKYRPDFYKCSESNVQSCLDIWPLISMPELSLLEIWSQLWMLGSF